MTYTLYCPRPTATLKAHIFLPHIIGVLSLSRSKIMETLSVSRGTSSSYFELVANSKVLNHILKVKYLNILLDLLAYQPTWP